MKPQINQQDGGLPLSTTGRMRDLRSSATMKNTQDDTATEGCAPVAGYATRTTPNEEGWWWYLEPNHDTSDAIPVEVYLHGGRLEAWHGKEKIITSYFGRWQKIAAPHWHTTKDQQPLSTREPIGREESEA